MPRLNQQFQPPDGRRLGFDEYGAPDGKPLFYFHGSPSSRLEARLYLSEDLLQSLDVRLIAVDRPGMGLSDFQPNRRLLDFPKDLLALADHLKIDRFATLAAGPVFSGGKLEAWIKWLFIFNGILFAIPTLILPALTMPTNAAGTGLGNQIGEYANIVWSFYVAIAAGLTAIVFRRLESTT